MAKKGIKSNKTLTINFLHNSMLGVDYHDYEDIKSFANAFEMEYGDVPLLHIIECKSQDEYDGFIRAINFAQLCAKAEPRSLPYVLISDAEVEQIKETNNVTIYNTI